MTKFGSVKKTIIINAQAIKQFSSMLFDHLKTAIDFVITKIDTKKTLSDPNKVIIVTLLSYSVVFATGYNLIKKIEVLPAFSYGYHQLSNLIVKFSHKSEPYIYDDKKAAELENEANELKKQRQADQYTAQQNKLSKVNVIVTCTHPSAESARGMVDNLMGYARSNTYAFSVAMGSGIYTEFCHLGGPTHLDLSLSISIAGPNPQNVGQGILTVGNTVYGFAADYCDIIGLNNGNCH